MNTAATLLARIADKLGAADALVFERTDGQLRLAGGHGRGTGWAGVVDVRLEDEPLALQAINQGRVLRVGARAPQRVIGPYWSSKALVVPVGDSHVVVFGGESMVRTADGELLRHAAEAASTCGEIPTDKLLADELEVVHAVRSLMDYRPGSVVETARHVAAVSAEALACDVGAVLIMVGDSPRIALAGDGVPENVDEVTLTRALIDLALRKESQPLVEQEVASGIALAGVDLVSRMALRIGRGEGIGLIVVGHSRRRPRGFTTLCQRVARSIAEAAEALLEHALVREELSDERDRYAREAHTDALTGLPNRGAWDQALATKANADEGLTLLAFDIRSLKQTNDSRGHAAGDALLKATADALRSAVRGNDVVARLGGDEFGVLLRDADARTADVVRARVEVACLAWSARSGISLLLATGTANARPGESLVAAFARADEAMCADKHGLPRANHDNNTADHGPQAALAL